MSLAPTCARCSRRHRVDLPCWSGRMTRRHLAALLVEYGDECCHCHQGGCDSVEHVVPRSRGGDDSLANTRPAHLDCNLRRGTRSMAGYAASARELDHSPSVAALLAEPTTSRTW